jgi:fluoroacetyl-CoA thioesterase
MIVEDRGLAPGRRATVTLAVAEEDTARAVGSGDVPVLASPRVLALAEQAAVKALGGALPEGKTSVGAWAELEHRLPSYVGETVAAKATLLGVHGRRLEFSISVTAGDGEDEVAHVRHHRVVVSRSRFVPSAHDDPSG